MYRGAAFVAVAGVSVTLQGCGGGTSSYELECKDSCKATVSCDDKKGFVSKPTGCKGSLDLVNPTDCPKFLDTLKKDDNERKRMCLLLEATPVGVNAKYICSDTCTVEIHCEKDSGNFKADGKGAGCVKKPTFEPKTFQECEKAVAKYDSDADAKSAICNEALDKAPQATKEIVIDCGDACVSKLMCDEHGAPSFHKGHFCKNNPIFKPAVGKCSEELDEYSDPAKRTEMCKAMGTQKLTDLEYFVRCDDMCQVELVCTEQGTEYLKVVDASCSGDIPEDMQDGDRQFCARIIEKLKKEEKLRGGFCKAIKDNSGGPTESFINCSDTCVPTIKCKFEMRHAGPVVRGAGFGCPRFYGRGNLDEFFAGVDPKTCAHYDEVVQEEPLRKKLCDFFLTKPSKGAQVLQTVITDAAEHGESATGATMQSKALYFGAGAAAVAVIALLAHIGSRTDKSRKDAREVEMPRSSAARADA